MMVSRECRLGLLTLVHYVHELNVFSTGNPKYDILETEQCKNIDECKTVFSSNTWGENEAGPDNCIRPTGTGANCGQASATLNFNKCHVDCSNRGLCNHANGQCKCFKGFYGENCALKSALAKGGF